MFDPIALGAQAVAERAVAAPPLVLLAGVLSSFGPCVAPRFIALAACVAQAPRPKIILVTFVAGLVAAYASFGIAASLLGAARVFSSVIYAAVAAGLLAGGLTTIVQAGHESDGARRARDRAERSLGGVFLLGASFAFVTSPCCTPIVAMILAYTSMVGFGFYGAALLAIFALGHALPLIAYGTMSGRVADSLRRFALRQAVSVTSGALMIGLAGYYGLLV
ncbi:MAG TPA: cytochrome c biogenesis protein CcdA [Candidatus Binatia bacterium]|nr:cytochrome c biogenesis protein CcdA [Candidatus Binatia bacterium]